MFSAKHFTLSTPTLSLKIQTTFCCCPLLSIPTYPATLLGTRISMIPGHHFQVYQNKARMGACKSKPKHSTSCVNDKEKPLLSIDAEPLPGVAYSYESNVWSNLDFWNKVKQVEAVPYPESRLLFTYPKITNMDDNTTTISISSYKNNSSVLSISTLLDLPFSPSDKRKDYFNPLSFNYEIRDPRMVEEFFLLLSKNGVTGMEEITPRCYHILYNLNVKLQ